MRININQSGYEVLLWYIIRISDKSTDKNEREIDMSEHKLFKPFVFKNGIEMRNRWIMAPMTTWSGNSDGTVSGEELAYYSLRSKEVGMVITATTYVEPWGKGFDGQFYSGTDEMIPSMKALSDVIHDGGALAVLQVFHAGRKAEIRHMPDGRTRSASAIAPKREPDHVPDAMTLDEIEAFIESFYQVVIRAHKAGYDGIEIHGANTYLIQQFFSPHSNRRHDQWGGSLENRARLPLAIVEATQRAKRDIGNDQFIVGYRFSPEENSEPGITLEDTDYLVEQLSQKTLDYLHISVGHYKDVSIRDQEDQTPITKRLSQIVNGRVPFIGVGGIHTSKEADEALALGVDFVAVGVQLIIEPNFISKMANQEIVEYMYYQDKYKALKIPKPMHEIIMKSTGWVPIT